jgi:hypothetical protein
MRTKRYRVTFTVDLDANSKTDWLLNHVENIRDQLADDGEHLFEPEIEEVDVPEYDYPSGESNCQYGDKG